MTRTKDDIHFPWQAQYFGHVSGYPYFAPRIGNDVAYVMRIVDDIDFVWQAQYLVRTFRGRRSTS